MLFYFEWKYLNNPAYLTIQIPWKDCANIVFKLFKYNLFHRFTLYMRFCHKYGLVVRPKGKAFQ